MFKAVEAAPILFEICGPPLVPGLLPDWLPRRPEGQDVNEHPLIIADPVVRPEIAAIASLGIPAHRDRLRAAPVRRWDAAVLALDEGPVDTAINLLGELPDLGLKRCVAIEIALGKQHPAKQQRGVHGRQLAIAAARSVGIVQEMIEKALVARDAA